MRPEAAEAHAASAAASRPEESTEPRDATRPSTDPPLYPVFLRLDGLPVVLVGGGAVAAGKLDGLLEAGARVTVIAPVIGAAIRTRATADHRLALVHRG